MIKKLKSGIATPKARAFLLFLFCSFLAWFISRLSETYTHTIAIPVEYAKAPDSLILVSEPPSEMQVRVRANGFLLMRYQISPKSIRVDLGQTSRKGGTYFIDPGVRRDLVAAQLDNAAALLEVPRDTLYLDFARLRSKTIPVQPRVQVELAQNYMMDGPLIVDPPRVHILGPPEEIDSLTQLPTVSLDLTDVNQSFERVVSLDGMAEYRNTKFSTTSVRVRGEVFRFSEIVIDVPVEVHNVPAGTEIRTFPDKVGILCKGKVEILKTLEANDFRVLADFEDPDPDTGRLPLRVAEKPEAVHSSVLLEPSVEFIVRRE